jgi:hypothetical protein
VCESQSSEVERVVCVCVCGCVCVGVLGGDSDCWASNVPERDGVGHFDGDTSGECTDLLMYVHEKCVRLPAAHFSNGVGVDPIQVHCHGAAGP